MHRLVLRPALAFATFVLIVVAVVQAGGRIGMLLVPGLEPALNRVLADEELRVRGLTGGWRGLNPVFRVDEITFPAGFARGLMVEVDVLETLGRGHPVFRRLEISASLAAVEHGPDGWWFAGMERGTRHFDWNVLAQSDEVRITGALMVAGDQVAGDRTNAMDFVLAAVNQGAFHGLDARIGQKGCECELVVQWRSNNPVWLLNPGERRLLARGSLPIHPALLGLPGVMSVDGPATVDVDIDWHQVDRSGGGRGVLRTRGWTLPDGGTFAASLAGFSRYKDGTHFGHLDEVEVRAGERAFRVPGVRFTGGATGVEAWVPEVVLDEVVAVLRPAFASSEKALGWIEGVNAGGRLEDVRAHVAIEEAGFGAFSFEAQVRDLALDGYKGVPYVRGAVGRVVGFDRGLRFEVEAASMEIGFPNLFSDNWLLADARGGLTMWFHDGDFGIRAPSVRVVRDGSSAEGGLSLRREGDQPDEARLAALLALDRMYVVAARSLMPYKLPEAMLKWVGQGPRGGELSDVRVAYQGRTKADSPLVTRRLELTARVNDATVEYRPDWPLASGVNGELLVSGTRGRFRLSEGEILGVRIARSEVRLHDNGAWLEVDVNGSGDMSEGLAFIRQSPLARAMTFVTPAWSGSGPVAVTGSLVIPLNPARTTKTLDADLAVTLQGVGLDMPDYRLPLADLTGTAQYRYPRTVTAEAIEGRLFGRAVTAAIESSDTRIDIRATGSATPATAWHLAGIEGWPFVTGEFPFAAHLGITPQATGAELRITTDLAGTRVALPSRLGKTAEASRTTTLNIQFLDGYQAVRFASGDVDGWLHLEDGPVRGAIGLGVPHPMVASNADKVVIAGGLERVELEAFLALGDQVGDTPVPWQVRDVTVAEVVIGEMPIAAVSVNGESRADGFQVQFDSAQLAGTVTRTDDAPLDLYFQHIRLPVDPSTRATSPDEGPAAVAPAEAAIPVEDDEDPVPPDVLARLPAARVVIDEARVGDEALGAWSFGIEPRPGGVRFANVAGTIRGVGLSAPEGIDWDAASNTSSATLTATMTDLAEVLSQWGYAPSVESEAASVSAALSWPGSPLNISLVALEGQLDFDAVNGRFLDAEGTNALRIFSLLNFAAITKRLTFDFSDIVGKGVSFDTIRAKVAFDSGMMRFREPMRVDGTGSKFQIGGSVNLVDESVDSEMILTLPVGRGLPWYAVYLGLANPLLGVGVLVGERVLRKPLEQVSSFKYRITGALEDPDVEFVSMFGTEMDAAGVDAGK